jgi:hypothetical protein
VINDFSAPLTDTATTKDSQGARRERERERESKRDGERKKIKKIPKEKREQRAYCNQ